MLTLSQTDGPGVWTTRPAVALLRRFAGPMVQANGEAYYDDLGLMQIVADEIEIAHTTSVDVALVPSYRGAICFSRQGVRFTATCGDTPLHYVDCRGPDDQLAGKSQLLMIVGASKGGKEQDNRVACIAAIRRIRAHRPKIYAQFLHWQAVTAIPELTGASR